MFTKEKKGGQLITVQDFKQQCEEGLLFNCDGYGLAMRDGVVCGYDPILPSRVDDIHSGVTHILWFGSRPDMWTYSELNEVPVTVEVAEKDSLQEAFDNFHDACSSFLREVTRVWFWWCQPANTP
ncbi:MAG: hypothetical protein GF411_14665 [Candidatus Lokiarchaeota archaeon]|nr:hypothetical protein [Candidatus Lokiarchaeota archaeon]